MAYFGDQNAPKGFRAARKVMGMCAGLEMLQGRLSPFQGDWMPAAIFINE